MSIFIRFDYFTAMELTVDGGLITHNLSNAITDSNARAISFGDVTLIPGSPSTIVDSTTMKVLHEINNDEEFCCIALDYHHLLYNEKDARFVINVRTFQTMSADEYISIYMLPFHIQTAGFKLQVTEYCGITSGLPSALLSRANIVTGPWSRESSFIVVRHDKSPPVVTPGEKFKFVVYSGNTDHVLRMVPVKIMKPALHDFERSDNE